MTATEQRVAIAKWIGWSCIEDCGKPLMMHEGFAMCGYPPENPIVGKKVSLPDFLNDLNAVHEAEKMLQDKCKYWPDYIDELSKLFLPTIGTSVLSQMCHASAAQRCEAILKVVGLWKDKSPPQPAP